MRSKYVLLLSTAHGFLSDFLLPDGGKRAPEIPPGNGWQQARFGDPLRQGDSRGAWQQRWVEGVLSLGGCFVLDS